MDFVHLTNVRMRAMRKGISILPSGYGCSGSVFSDHRNESTSWRRWSERNKEWSNSSTVFVVLLHWSSYNRHVFATNRTSLDSFLRQAHYWSSCVIHSLSPTNRPMLFDPNNRSTYVWRSIRNRRILLRLKYLSWAKQDLIDHEWIFRNALQWQS